MKILAIENGSQTKAVTIKALLGTHELEQLNGTIADLCVFAVKAIGEPTSFTKTGARHSHAKYLLMPATLRRKFPADGFDYEHLTCGAVQYKDALFVIYRVPRVDHAAQH
jgi:hypothetical protein